MGYSTYQNAKKGQVYFGRFYLDKRRLLQLERNLLAGAGARSGRYNGGNATHI